MIKTQKLTDIGEGIKEVMVNQWFVEEGAHVEEWDKLCESQSDKSTVEISARYSGVVKRLYVRADESVQVGQALVDIDVQGEEEESAKDGGEGMETGGEQEEEEQEIVKGEQAGELGVAERSAETDGTPEAQEAISHEGETHSSLATPAVRRLLKEHRVAIEDVHGTGKDGRILKEDVHKYLAERDSPSITTLKPIPDARQVETPQRLTPIQATMFHTMSASLSIPHFLYSDSVNVAQLSSMRKNINRLRLQDSQPKISYLPFIVKAVSLALNKYPLLNSRLDTASNPSKPRLILRSHHNIGIAMDTSAGLLVPVVKNVGALSVESIASEIARLSARGKDGQLSKADLTGGTITVSNVGSIGGEVVAPVIVEDQLAILGVGKIRAVPVFNEKGDVERAEMVGFSWSADHRVVDGATMARMARCVQDYLEEPGRMVVQLG